MSSIPRIIVCTLLSALQCAILAAAVFAVGAVVDGTAVGDALAFAAVVGIIGSLIGALIGLIIGIFDLRPLPGGLVGALGTAAAVGFYVLTFGRPGAYSYFLGESAIILVVLALPTVLAGVLTALEKNLLFKAS